MGYAPWDRRPDGCHYDSMIEPPWVLTEEERREKRGFVLYLVSLGVLALAFGALRFCAWCFEPQSPETRRGREGISTVISPYPGK